MSSLVTRKPTGKAPWPILLIAGTEKAGKSFAAAQASASELVGRTLWFGIGEDDPDEYGSLGPFEIVTLDGTYRALVNSLTAALSEPPADGKPTLWVLDSGTRLWALLSDMAQVEANRRWKGRAVNQSKPIPDDGISINMDLWNIAKNRWQHVLELLRQHQGPSIITARLEETTVMDGDKPTKDKFWKVQAEKGLPFDVGCIVELRSRGDAYLTGVRSLRWVTEKSHESFPKFTVDDLWRKLGLAEETGTRTHTGATGEASMDADDTYAANRAALLAEVAELAGDGKAQVAADWLDEHGHPINATTDLGSLELLRDDLRLKAKVAA